MMAARAAAASRPPTPASPSSSSSPPSSSRVVALPPKSQRLRAPLRLHAATSVSLLALFSTPGSGFGEANAFHFDHEQILSTLTQVETALNQLVELYSQALEIARSVLRFLIGALKPSVDAALPVLEKAGEEAIKITSPVVSDASNQAKEALQSAGFDPSPILSAFQTVTDVAQETMKVVESAKPIASSTVETIASTDPGVIAGTCGALFLTYLLFPPVWSAISFNFMGYKGNLSPAQTLDMISTQNSLFIDIRSEKDKNKAGVPHLPSSAKSRMISIPYAILSSVNHFFFPYVCQDKCWDACCLCNSLEELPDKIRSLVRDVKKVEAELVALKISYLKRVNKGSSIIIMDSYADSAKIVARALTSLGFNNCWIMMDGFSGAKGWLQSPLGIDSYVSFAEVIPPSRIIPAAIGRIATIRSGNTQAPRKLFPERRDG